MSIILKSIISDAKSNYSDPNWMDKYINNGLNPFIEAVNNINTKKLLNNVKQDLINRYQESKKTKSATLRTLRDPPPLAWEQYQQGIQILNQTPTGDGGLGIQQNFIQIANNFGNISLPTLDSVTHTGNTTLNSIFVGNVTGNHFIGNGSLLTGITGTNQNLQQVTNNGNTTTNSISVGGLNVVGIFTGNLSGTATNAINTDNATNATNAGANGILYYNSGGQLTSQGPDGLNYPNNFTLVDYAGNLYVANNLIGADGITTIYSSGYFTGGLNTGGKTIDVQGGSIADNGTTIYSAGNLYVANNLIGADGITTIYSSGYFTGGLNTGGKTIDVQGGSIADNGTTIYSGGVLTIDNLTLWDHVSPGMVHWNFRPSDSPGSNGGYTQFFLDTNLNNSDGVEDPTSWSSRFAALEGGTYNNFLWQFTSTQGDWTNYYNALVLNGDQNGSATACLQTQGRISVGTYPGDDGVTTLQLNGGTFDVQGGSIADNGTTIYYAGVFTIENVIVNGLINFGNDSTSPTNVITPVGWQHIQIAGVDSWLPIYR